MKRDMELIRAILLEVEGETPPPDTSHWNNKQKAYHAALLLDAGLVKGSAFENYYQKEKRAVELHRLTWQGHEFLDATRDSKIWKLAKEKVLKPGASWTFSLLIEWLKQEAHQRILGTHKSP
jgi:hypothetical protein